jgi:hypothetical protein
VPLITPLRRTVETMVAKATAVPTQGNERDNLRESFIPPHLAILFVFIMSW